jgi:hypothetical protein
VEPFYTNPPRRFYFGLRGYSRLRISSMMRSHPTSTSRHGLAFNGAFSCLLTTFWAPLASPSSDPILSASFMSPRLLLPLLLRTILLGHRLPMLTQFHSWAGGPGIPCTYEPYFVSTLCRSRYGFRDTWL